MEGLEADVVVVVLVIVIFGVGVEVCLRGGEEVEVVEGDGSCHGHVLCYAE